ncbi:MAG: DUF262 domain-containing protein [Chloroflexaceae bacterium]|jgi:hypothetical protein|nr:DUF262 domain-containing protein [Chloroflexaceae bacterium]
MLDTNPLNLLSIILNYRFVIPVYQRPYTWDEEKILELWNDVKENWVWRYQNVDNNANHNHFLGSVLTTTVPDGQPGQLYIVDGQQRMTSLTIFAAALIDVFNSNQVAYDDNLLAMFRGNKSSVFIILNEGSDYFYNVIIEPSRAEDSREARKQAISTIKAETEVESKIKGNYVACYKAIEHYVNNLAINENKQRHLKGLLSTFLNFLYVVKINVPIGVNIIRIFHTLNARGEPLSTGDIVKSIIFGSVWNKPNEFAKVSELWQDVFGEIESEPSIDVITSYLRHHYISTRNYVAERDLTKVYQTIVEPNSIDGSSHAVKLLESLKDEAEHYNTLLQSDSKSDETNTHITLIRDHLNVTLSFPALLAALGRWSQNPVTLNQFLRLTENFLFRYFHIQANKNIPALETFMSDIAKVIRTNQNALPIVQQMYKDKSADGSFLNAFLIANIGPNITKYVIGKLERQDNVQLMRFISNTNFKLNYLMPRVPNQYFAKNDIDVDCYRRIGNLLIWSSKLKLDRTLNTLRNQQQNPLPVNLSSVLQVLDKHQYWGPDAIIERQTILAKDVNTIWSLS